MDPDVFAQRLRQVFPVLDEPEDLSLAAVLVEAMGSEFCASLRLDPAMVAATCCYGYMPMGFELEGYDLLLIKCHDTRSVIDFENLHVSGSTVRRARGLVLEIDRDFDGCLAATVAAHVDRWLVEPLCASLASLHRDPQRGVRAHSVEVRADGRLVAGEVGYTCGAVYTSLAGFHSLSGAGSVQLVCLGRILERAGFSFWDLGMDLEYKRRLGARLLEREEFLRRYKNESEKKATLPAGPFDCGRVLRARRLSPDRDGADGEGAGV
jgi:Leu/Phe-tRNA-protein transferase